MTAPKREERGLGFFFGERDRQTLRARSRFVFTVFFSEFSLRCRIYHWRASSSSISLSLPLESMSVIARCATFVATKTSLKQQFAVNNRSSATKIVRYAIKERKRWECLHLIILRFCDCFFFVFWEFELKKRERKWREKTTSYCSLFSLVVCIVFRRRRRFSSSSSS